MGEVSGGACGGGGVGVAAGDHGRQSGVRVPLGHDSRGGGGGGRSGGSSCGSGCGNLGGGAGAGNGA